MWEWIVKISDVVNGIVNPFAKLGDIARGLGLGSGNAGGLELTSNDRGVFQLNGQTIVKNNDLANRLTTVGNGIYSGAKQCLRGVWMTQQAVMRGTSVITAGKAYRAADQLAQDRRFKEIEITPDMYRRAMAGDKQMQALLHGANVIYDRNSGFNPTAGHAEIWDMNNKKALYGLGPASLQRSDQMIQHARVFIPVGQQTVNTPNRTGGNGVSGGTVGRGSGNTIHQTITVNAKSGDPQAIGKEVAKQAGDSTAKALNKATVTLPIPKGRS